MPANEQSDVSHPAQVRVHCAKTAISKSLLTGIIPRCSGLAGGGCKWLACEHVVLEHFPFDPGVGFGEAFTKLDGGFPVELLLDEGVVAVAAVDAFGRVE